MFVCECAVCRLYLHNASCVVSFAMNCLLPTLVHVHLSSVRRRQSLLSPTVATSGPCNSFYCLGHFKNVYHDDDDAMLSARIACMRLVATDELVRSLSICLTAVCYFLQTVSHQRQGCQLCVKISGQLPLQKASPI